MEGEDEAGKLLVTTLAVAVRCTSPPPPPSPHSVFARCATVVLVGVCMLPRLRARGGGHLRAVRGGWWLCGGEGGWR